MSKSPALVNSPIIKAWAKKNPERAKELGLRLIQNRNNPEALDELPSLGDFEDKAQGWALKHPTKAKLLIMGMIKDFVKK